jgi:hypothetical protein
VSTPVEPAAPVATGRAAGRGVKTVADMFRSLTVVVVGIVVLFGSIGFAAYRYHGRPHLDSDDAGAVAAIRLARAQARFPVLAPGLLPKGWTATSATWDTGGGTAPAVLHLGYVTPADHYVDLEESGSDVAPLLATYEHEPVAAGTTVVAGTTWTVRRSTDGSLSWTWHTAGRWIGLTGGASPAELAVVAASLR